VVLRVPYPLSFYAKGLDGRIDDANAGWRGRGVWTTSGDRTPWLKEGGKGTVPIAFLSERWTASAPNRASGKTPVASGEKGS
jgi:hypothetical protein